MAAVHIVRGPARAGKTERFLERCRALAGPGSILWLSPNRRCCEGLRARLANVPDLLLTTFPDLAGELIAASNTDVQPLPHAQAHLLADEVLAEMLERQELAHFGRVAETRGFLKAATALIEELQQHDIPPDLVRADVKLGECAALLAGYRQLLHNCHLADFEERVTLARSLLAAGQSELSRMRGVFVDDFSDLTTPQIELLALLAERTEELWLSLPDEEGDDRAELFAAARRTAERLSRLQPRKISILPASGVPVNNSPFTGLTHLRANLFRPVRQASVSEDASGLHLLQAPGLVGEVRLVARRIKVLLMDGILAEDILVGVRDLLPYADLAREVFGEYGIPLDVEGTEPILRHPLVALLLKALRLPDEDWPFAGVTALLRSSVLKPDWPETRFDASVPLQAEALLRLLGEPRGRESYLFAVRRWATEKPRGLEDEQAEESRRQRTHELAKQCAPFLERFFSCWNDQPSTALLPEHVAWMHGLAADLGLHDDAPAWRRFWEEVQIWSDREARRPGRRRLDRRTFQRRLHILATEAGLARTPHGPGRVRVLSAELAATLAADHLFVLGLGERGFPRLAVPSSLLDETERQSLRKQGHGIACLSDVLTEEMLLFYRLVTRASRSLVLSYPAVDHKGQPLLPSSFLSAVLDLFAPDAVPVERRSMLLEGNDRDEPLSPAEQRVRLALAMASRGRQNSEIGFTPGASAPGSPMLTNLRDAAVMAHQRLRSRELGPHEGMLLDPTLIAEVGRLFGPERIFSPTALEDYVACPFRFFMKNVMRLELLEDPREEIEMTRRGQAFHRALSRLHRRLRERGVHQPDEELEDEMRRELGAAIDEDVARAAGPASKMLWELEGQRMQRVGQRYPDQWRALLAPWLKVQVSPEPYFFEVDFGLPAEEGQEEKPPLILRKGAMEVRVSGRIDRVDVADLGEETGFWIIDYKSGRGEHYTSKALADFQRLQLTLYALAVQEVLLKDRKARPLGMAYWLLSEAGPKVVLPAKGQTAWLEGPERWERVQQTLTEWVTTLVGHIREGKYPLRPRSEYCTQTCDFGQVCRISQSRSVEKDWTLPLPVIAGERGQT